MAPSTNIGSSTPIDSSGSNLGSDLRRKVINDSVASLTALAQTHHRNTSWPAKAVRVASNLTASQALKMHVIDLIEPTLPALLNRLNGYHTKDAQRPYTLHLAGAQIDTVKPGFITRLLNTVIDPKLLSILFLAGLVGLIFEVLHPGIVLPGALGAVCLVIALYGFSVLNPSWGGVALVVLGVALLVIDLHAMTHGALTIGGLIALGFGLALLFQNEPSTYQVNTWLIVGIGTGIAAFWSLALGKGLAARRRPVQIGPEAIVGKTGEVREGGLVYVNGELWHAHADDDSDLVPGEEVEVEAIHGLEPDRTSESRINDLMLGFVRIMREYERGVMFRLGRLLETRGPGVVWKIPFVDQIVKVDLRTITLNIPPQEVITKDNVPVRVNAVAYFRIVDPKSAVVQVENFMVATSQKAQTTLRSVLGQHSLDELLSEREKINAILQEIIDEADRPLGHQGLRGRGQGRRDPERDAARDGEAGGGRARAAREDHQRRGRVPGRRAAQGCGDRDRGAPDRAAAALLADAARDRRRQLVDDHLPGPDRPDQAVFGKARGGLRPVSDTFGV